MTDCAATRRLLGSRYEEARFNQAVDQSTGDRTRTILCMPLKGADGEVIAVIQLINKATGAFTEEDEEMMNSFLTIAAPILEVRSRVDAVEWVLEASLVRCVWSEAW